MNEASTTIAVLLIGLLAVIVLAATSDGTMFGPLNGMGF